MNDFWPDPWQQQTGMPRSWDDFFPDHIPYSRVHRLGLFEPPMMRFYSEETVKMILEEHSRHLERERIRAKRLPEMVDDVAGQWTQNL